MRKRLVSLLLSALMLALTVTLPAQAEPTEQAPRAVAPSLSAQSAVLIDARYGLVLTEKNADIRLPMASTTKIMTALTALTVAAPETIIKVAPEAVGVEGSSVYLTEGEELTLSDLLCALLLQSANDAAAAIAIGLGGSIAGFADLMNAEAAKLGLTDTHFVNPHGLDDDAHYTTARELATVTRAALELPLLRRLVGTIKATIPHGDDAEARLLVNHNRLLRTYAGAIGVKTGYTKRSGRCLVSAAERDGVTLIAVTLNDPDDWRDHEALLDYGFSCYRSVTLCRAGDAADALAVTGGTAETVGLRYAEELTVALPIGHSLIGVRIEAPHFLYAPITLDTAVGEAVYTCDLDGDGSPEELGRAVLITDSAVERTKTRQSGFFAWLRSLFRT